MSSSARSKKFDKHYNITNVDYKLVKGKPIIYIYCRGLDNKRHTFKVAGFKPYFYVDTEPQWADLLDLFGKPARKITVDQPGQVKFIRDNFYMTYEDNIPFGWRYLYDKDFWRGVGVRNHKLVPAPALRIDDLTLFFDAEVSVDPYYNLKTDDPIWPMVTLQYALSNDIGRVTIGILDPDAMPNQTDSNYLVLNRDDPYYSEWFKKANIILDDLAILVTKVRFPEESQLLHWFIKEIRRINPDRLSAYWGEAFDIPYFISRCIRNRVPYKGLSPLLQVEVKGDKTRKRVIIKGREFIDFLKAYKQLKRTSEDVITSYDYKDVVAQELGIIYTDIGDNFRHYHNNDHEARDYYCALEAFTMTALSSHIVLMRGFDLQREISGCSTYDAMFNSRSLWTLCHRLSERPIPSSRHAHRRPRGKIIGALTTSPSPGLHLNVAVFDIKGLYPANIMSKNLSPEMLDDTGDIVIGDYEDGMVFRSEPEGLVPRITSMMVGLREQYRSQRLRLTLGSTEHKIMDVLEKRAKGTANSTYGELGFTGFGLYDPRVANAVTYEGRAANILIAKVCERLGYKVIYSDTDSVFVELGTSDWKEGYKLEQILMEELEIYGHEFGAKFPLEIKYEKFYKRIMFKRDAKGNPIKKKHSGHLIMRDGNSTDLIHTMGFELKRSDSSKVLREVMTKVFELLLKEGDAIGTAEYIKATDTWIRNGGKGRRVHDFAFPRGLTKDPEDYKHNDQWALGVRTAEKLFRKRWNPNFKPLFIPTKGIVGYPRYKRFCLISEAPLQKQVVIDWDAIADRTIKKKFAPILWSLGYDWSFVQEKLVQTRFV